MIEGLFPRAIGRALARVEGLNGAFLPFGIGRDAARGIAREANKARGDGATPFAIVVTGEPEPSAVAGVTEVTVNDATRYREGDRLAVFVGQQADLASVGNTFREVLTPSFPDESMATLPLADVGGAALEQALLAAELEGADGRVRDMSTALQLMTSTLEVLADGHRELGSSASPWNALWFEHVDTGLGLLVDALQRADEAEELEQLLLDTIPAVFSLPRPQDGRTYRKRFGRAIKNAVEQWWSDGDTIATTVALLTNHPDTGAGDHALAAIDWENFDRTAVARDSSLLALATHDLQAPDRVGAFRDLTEAQFTNPVVEGGVELEVQTEDGQRLDVVDVTPSLHMLGPTTYEAADGESRVCSPALVVRVPTIGHLDVVPTGAAPLLVTTPKSARFELAGDPYFVDDGDLHIRGRIVMDVATGSFTYRPKRRRLALAVAADDPLAGQLDPKADLDYVLLPPDGAGGVFLPLTSRGMAGTPSVVAPERFDDSGFVEAGEETLVFPASASKRYVAVLWGANLEGAPTMNGVALARTQHPAGLCVHEFSPSGSDDFNLGDLHVEVQVESGASQPISPVVAAVQKCAPSSDEAGPTLRSSLRGMLEDVLSSRVHSDRWASSLGHVVLPSDRNSDLRVLTPLGGGEWQGPADLQRIWADLGDRSVPDQVLRSSAADRFREAFEALDVARFLERTDEAGTTYSWPSRTSWAPLWDRRADLEEYLTAHTELVEKARDVGHPNGIFWAAYPFCTSVRETDPAPGRCIAVLMSPLHPVRLAWLAGVEHTLRRAASAATLAGTVEGWNFPLVGPHDSTNGRMLAVPIDNGEGQLFLGWSMLVEASVTGPKQLGSPEFIAGRRAPGTAASGLNAGGVAAALRDYRRMNPHVTTLTLDLAASLAAPRLSEIDAAVLEEMEDWANEAAGLPGGARVMDSLNRRGDAPREQLSELLATRLKAPVTWSRYRPETGRSRPTNVRVLQDAGVALEVDSSASAGRGRTAPVPLRRFEVPGTVTGASASATSAPGLPEEGGWTPFNTALRAIEAGSRHGGSPLVNSQLVGGLLASGDADWTISGEAMVNPASLASLLEHGDRHVQMLWEWRPPFLDVGGQKSGTALLERRPYLSVVKIPKRFENDILEKLTRVVGEDKGQAAVRDLLKVLGARGVGLSSLVSMGGSHASGALGFYTTLKLLDVVDTSTADQYVMPIDVCDKFLLALAGHEYHAADQQRADLLVMTLTDAQIVLTPIEIKFYGFETAEKNLPALGSPRLSEALSQLASTSRLCDAIEDRWQSLAPGPELDLAVNGLAALLEAGMRLSQRADADLNVVASRLQGVLDGGVAVRSGRPLLAYFLRGAQAPDGSGVVSGTLKDHAELSCGEHGEFLADPTQVLAELGGAAGAASDAWSELVRWSTQGEPPRDESRIPHRPAVAAEPEATRLVQDDAEAPSAAPADVPVVEELEPTTTAEAGGPHGRATPDGTEGRAATKDEPEPARDGTVASAGERPSEERPVIGDGIRFDVGTLLDSVGDAVADYWPSNTSLNQPNVGVVGDLGTGKTQLLKALVRNLRVTAEERQLNPLSFLIFDYKRDFQDDAFLRDVGGEVLKPQDIPLNIFGIDGEYEEQLGFKKAQTFIDVLKKIFGGIGPVQTNHLLTVLLGLYERHGGEAPTMAEVLEHYKDEVGSADSVVGVLNQFVLGHVFSSDKSSLVPFDDLIHNKVLVVDLNSLGADQSLKNALVVFFLNQYYEYMQRLTKWPYIGAAPDQLRRLNSYLLVDEATNIMQYNFDVLEQLMLQGREFGVGVILASQYLSHFQVKGVNYGEPLRTWFIHKVPNVAQKELTRLGLPAASAKDAARISELDVHEAYYSSLNFPGRFIRGIPYFELAGA